MTTSARNRWPGRITAIVAGDFDAEVQFTLAGGQSLSAVVTTDSVRKLGLVVGGPVTALVKAPAVLLATGGGGAGPVGCWAAAAVLAGQVQAVTAGPLNASVALRLPGGDTVHAIVTLAAVAELDLVPGAAAWAVIPASQVLLTA
jgi:molybdate transport system regulatory protein